MRDNFNYRKHADEIQWRNGISEPLMERELQISLKISNANYWIQRHGGVVKSAHRGYIFTLSKERISPEVAERADGAGKPRYQFVLHRLPGASDVGKLLVNHESLWLSRGAMREMYDIDAEALYEAGVTPSFHGVAFYLRRKDSFNNRGKQEHKYKLAQVTLDASRCFCDCSCDCDEPDRVSELETEVLAMRSKLEGIELGSAKHDELSELIGKVDQLLAAVQGKEAGK